MKIVLKLLIAIIFAFSIILSAQDLPVAGQEYKIVYDPDINGILTNSDSINLVYAFDYWGTTYSYTQGWSKLFLNVLYPDSGRAQSAKLLKTESLWSAKIEIPDSVSLLSYYFTNGEEYDYNDKKTYVEFIYDHKKKPVRNARFRNIDFLIMADASLEEQIEEIKKEIDDYPENFIAYSPYWRMKFSMAKSIPELRELKSEFENQFNELKNELGETDSLLVAQASVYYTLPGFYYNLIRTETAKISETMFDIITRIPEEKRGRYLSQAFNISRLNKEAEIFLREAINKPAPDFEFTSIEGKSNKLSNFRGNYVLLDFWGSWCGPCVAEIPHLKNVYKKFKEKNFQIISISNDFAIGSKSKDEFKKYVKDNEMDWIHVLDSKDKKILSDYKIVKFPSLFLIDKMGKIIKIDEKLRGKELETTLSELL